MRIGFSPRVEAVLKDVEADREFPGSTHGPTLLFLYWWIVEHAPKRVLQLGTLIGYSAITMADALEAGGGKLLTVDPDTTKLTTAERYAGAAGVRDRIEFLPGRSTDRATILQAGRQGPFDLIYLDTRHAYEETLVEISIYTSPPFFGPNTALVLHDTSLHAQTYDPTDKGGVRPALQLWHEAESNRAGFTVQWFEPPLTWDPSGMALVRARR